MPVVFASVFFVMPFSLFVFLLFGSLGLAFQIYIFIGMVPLQTRITSTSSRTTREADYFPDRIGLSRMSVSELLLPCRFLCEREGRTSSPDELPGKFPYHTATINPIAHARFLTLFFRRSSFLRCFFWYSCNASLHSASYCTENTGSHSDATRSMVTLLDRCGLKRVLSPLPMSWHPSLGHSS